MPERRVLITTSYLHPADDVHQLLAEAGCEVTYSRQQDRAAGGAPSLASAIAEAHAVIAGTDRFSADIIDAAGNLGLIARTGSGYDNVDMAAAERRGIAVCTTPMANGRSVAELTIGLMMACARNITSSAEQVRAGSWIQASGRELLGATVGIIGLGGIGKEVARLALALGMRVLAYDTTPDEAFMESAGIGSRTLAGLLSDSDFVTIHIALTPHTRRLIDRDTLGLMKPDAYLINTSRGAVVDEEALADALNRHQIAGAALDVLDIEPLEAQSPLRTVPNLLITPHIAGATVEARARSSRLAATQVIDFFDGRPVAHPVLAQAPDEAVVTEVS